jgi:putative Mg2+ transporter-C (MgtC) family protein
METIGPAEMSLRLAAALAAGLVIGMERESRGRPAGLRTTILTCLAASTAMVLSEALFIRSDSAAPSGAWRPDPARLGAGILTGIGFLGAGTIMRHEHIVRGVTTAATLWFVTVLGLAYGAGHYGLGIAATVLALIVLTVLPHLEKHLPQDWFAELALSGKLDTLDQEAVRQHLKESGVKVKTCKVTCDLENQRKTLVLELKLVYSRRYELSRTLTGYFASQPGITRVEWK